MSHSTALSVSGQITWNFETGNLSGWTVTGNAFNNQPTLGDNIRARSPGVNTGMEGNFFVGTFEDRPNDSRPLGSVQGDGPTGTMTSNLFSANFRQVSFSVGGGSDYSRLYVAFLIKATPENRSRFENVREPDGTLMPYPRVRLDDGEYYEFYRFTGRNNEAMRRETLGFDANIIRAGDLCRVRIVDESSEGWGHINVDDFRFEGTLGTPAPSNTLIRVVNDGGSAIADAEVIINDETTAVRTNGAGEVRRRLSAGDRIVARKRIGEHRYWRGGHSQGSTQNWNWRVHLTNVTINNDGSAAAFSVSDSSIPQVVTLRRDNALVGIHLVVSVEWDANSSEIAELRRHFTEASNYLYNATDGQISFEQVEIATNKIGWDDADIRIHANNMEWPHADIPFGFYPSPLPGVIAPGLIHMPFLPTAKRYTSRDPRVYAHEFGHYGFGLYDEYTLGLGVRTFCTIRRFDPSSPFAAGQPRAACMMDRQNDAPKICSRHRDNPHRHGEPLTWVSIQADSCWAKILGDFGNPRALDLPEGAYRLKSPDTRDAIPGTVPLLPLPWQTRINVDARPRGGLRNPLSVTLNRRDGTPLRNSRVYVRTYYGQEIDHGETDDAGQITLIGVHAGDTIRFDGNSRVIARHDSMPEERSRTGWQLAAFRPVTPGQDKDTVKYTVMNEMPPLQLALEPLAGGKLQVRLRVQGEQVAAATVTANSGGKDQPVAMREDAATRTWVGTFQPNLIGEVMLSVNAEVDKGTAYALRRFRLPSFPMNGHPVYTPDGSSAITLADDALPKQSFLTFGPALVNLPPLDAKQEIISGPVAILSSVDAPLKEGKIPNTIRFNIGASSPNAKSSQYAPDSMSIYHLPVGADKWNVLETTFDQHGETAIAAAKLDALGTFVLVARPLLGSTPGGKFAVTETKLKADVADFSGKCPATIKFTGYITTNGAGTVKYAFTRSDGATGPVFTLDFKEAGTQAVGTSWTLGDATTLPTYKGWQALKIISPNELESSQETGIFSLTCGTP